MARSTAEATCAPTSIAAGPATKLIASNLSNRLVTLAIVASMAAATLFPLSTGQASAQQPPASDAP
ncbi:hypothetical protein PtA15_3A459 [Puccinia triticina]|uniref:Uncharacterized protein n=1 Tax=Puccinia triticina TaxID=208348 RepID=A0ABY7CF32_9BASI|nr:uncharacterized protein PtA15_3A459 [Puccinia triticina]WAQ83092.1 hypothetical protein PtA15_3A459 [Puccinia triticina]